MLEPGLQKADLVTCLNVLPNMHQQCLKGLLELQLMLSHAGIVIPMGGDVFLHPLEDAANQHQEVPLHHTKYFAEL